MEARGILFVNGEATEAITTRLEYQNRPRLLWAMRGDDSRYRADETLLWRDGLTAAFNAVTQDIGVLFDAASEWSRVWPTQRVLMEAISAINGLDAVCGRTNETSVFASPDFLGWVYQFFNVDEKEAIREQTGGKPRTSHELAVINQFYTPDWIVKFLVDNTLGRVWLQMHPDTRMREQISYLVPNTGENASIPLKPARELKLLDPACGTMHMGQYAFGLLYEMYLEEIDRVGEQGWPDEPSASHNDIPTAILANNLHGIDIDPRAIQIAALTLMLTMKEQAKLHGLDPRDVRVKKMNLVCANAVDLGIEHMNEFIKGLDPAVFGGTESLRRAVHAIWTNLKHVAELGSLVQVGEEVERALSMPVRIRIRTFAPGQLPLDEQWGAAQLALSSEEKTTARQHVEAALSEFIREHSASSDINTKLFAQETGKALSLLDLLSQRYDSVVMNPPYGDFVPTTVMDIQKMYPCNAVNIYGAFLERGFQLLHKNGFVGALTSRTFLNLHQFEALRRQVLLNGCKISTVLDLGYGVLDGATVETSAMVASNGQLGTDNAAFIRLDSSSNKEVAFRDVIDNPDANDKLTWINPQEFTNMPGARFFYWLPVAVRRLFNRCKTFEPAVSDVRAGLQTCDDDRFLRYYWEVTDHSVGSDLDWSPLAKGGDYCRYYSDINLIIRWRNNGFEVKEFAKSRGSETTNIRSQSYYFREGVTFPNSSASWFSARHMPAGTIISVKGQGVYVHDEFDIFTVLALLNSELIGNLLNVIHPGKDFQAGDVKLIPIVPLEARQAQLLSDLARRIYSSKLRWDGGNEMSRAFDKPWLVQLLNAHPCDTTLSEAIDKCLELEMSNSRDCQSAQDELDNIVYDVYCVSPQDRCTIERELGSRPLETVWPQMDGKSQDQKRIEHVCRLLSYLAKATIEADPDGIVPLVPCGNEQILAERVRNKMEAMLDAERSHMFESEIINLLGRRATIESWLASQYFKYHLGLYKRRPIYWHIVSDDGSFGVIVHYHRFNLDRLKKLRSVYLDDFITCMKLEIGRLAKETDTDSRSRLAELEGNLKSAEALDDKLRMIEEGEYAIKVPWKSEADQPKGWRPDLDDGVKVNIAPFEAAGVLAVKKVT
jgi:hypothetical protein